MDLLLSTAGSSSWLNLSAAVAIAGVITGLAALAVAYASKQMGKREVKVSERDDAREEAMELAKIRGQVIEDLRDRLRTLEGNLESERTERRDQVHRLQVKLDQQRDDALSAQQLFLHSVRTTTNLTLTYLEKTPPDTDAAIAVLRDLLAA